MNCLEYKNSVELLAPAKINLTLEVLFKREDGYHELRSVMQNVTIFDRLLIKKNRDNLINISCSVPLPEKNTVRLAAEAYVACGGCGGADIYLQKEIPSEAGLGGASADAAAVLYGMEKLFGTFGGKTAALFETAKKIGADVPFCLLGGCALAGGIGEKLSSLPVPELNLVVIKPNAGISTPMLFKSLNLSPAAVSEKEIILQKRTFGTSLRLAKLLSSRHKGIITADLIQNELMPPAVNVLPEIQTICNDLLSCGASAAQMTGSGSAVYGIFESFADALAAEQKLSRYSFCRACKTSGGITEV